MSTTLIAVVLALFLGHVVTALAHLRRYGWFDRWLEFGQRQLKSLFASPASILLSLGLPLVLTGWLQAWLDGHFFGVPGFLFALLVLVYCWGPRDLDRDVEALIEAPDAAARERVWLQLTGRSDLPAEADEGALVDAVFQASVRRWFGPLLWFLLLGPFGAVLYRLTAHVVTQPRESMPVPHLAAYRHLLAILDWPVAHLMTLALAVAGSFDAVYRAWQQWHRQRRSQPFDFSTGFLAGAAHASVQQYQQHQARQDALDRAAGLTAETPEPAAESPTSAIVLHATMALIWRVLVAWLVVLALFVLAGYV